MAEITASMVKELRELTGAGMMDCKKALNEANGNMDEAVEILRKSGQAKAVKKEGRIAAEGICRIARQGDTKAAVVEVNSETDFVAKNETSSSMLRLWHSRLWLLPQPMLKRSWRRSGSRMLLRP